MTKKRQLIAGCVV